MVFSEEVTQYLINMTLNARQMLLLYFIYNENIEDAMNYIDNCESMKTEDFYKLEMMGFIKLVNPSKKYYISSYEVTDFFTKITNLKQISKPSLVDSWIDEWFELFPTGVKTGGKYVKTSKEACNKRMKEFIKVFPNYNKDIIIEATRKYIEDREKNNYNYFMLAPYFIKKDGMSTLASWCEEVINEESVFNQDDPFTTKA